MKKESSSVMFPTEMGGRGLKAFRENSRVKFPLELLAEEPGGSKICRAVAPLWLVG